MNEILRLLKEAFGIRPLIPILLIIVAGFIFKTKNRYPISELFYDRWYLISCVLILSLSVSYYIYNSGLAKRTPVGQYGVYIGYFEGDSDKSLHSKVFESLKANLDAKTYPLNIRVSVKNLGMKIADDDGEKILKLMDKLNASVIIWGAVVEKDLLYPRIWSHSDVGEPRSFEPVRVSDLPNLSSLSESIWERIESIRTDSKETYLTAAHLSERIDQIENKLQNTLIHVDRLISGQITSRDMITPPEVHAVLVGIGNYPRPFSPLHGPANDVASMKNILLERNPSSKINILLDENATHKNIIETTSATAQELGSEKTLLVYFSGHGSISYGISYYYPIDFQFKNDAQINSINLTEFIEDIVLLHPRTIFIFDVPFDSSSLKKDVVKNAALMVAGPAPNLVLEVLTQGKYMGAFTSAIEQTFRSVPSNNAVKLNELFQDVLSILGVKYPNMKPYLLGEANTLDSLSL